MEISLDDFSNKVEGFESLSASEKCDYFVYFLTVVNGADGIKPKEVEECFSKLRIHKYSNVAQYLRINSTKQTSKQPKFIKEKDCYHISRNRRLEIEAKVILDRPHIETSKTLRDLLPMLSRKSEKEFLVDAIKSFEVEAYRASIVMVWLLTIDHLFEYILSNKLEDFNYQLAKISDKRVKATKISSKDDFGDIPEGKFIELCRASNVISNDVRKILETKLGIRNSAAHPSNIHFGKGKTYEFIEDLINNVILKY